MLGWGRRGWLGWRIERDSWGSFDHPWEKGLGAIITLACSTTWILGGIVIKIVAVGQDPFLHVASSW